MFVNCSHYLIHSETSIHRIVFSHTFENEIFVENIADIQECVTYSVSFELYGWKEDIF